jgi:hypothetical protein
MPSKKVTAGTFASHRVQEGMLPAYINDRNEGGAAKVNARKLCSAWLIIGKVLSPIFNFCFGGGIS